MSDSGSDNEIRCNACGFEASYVPEGMLSCEKCGDVHYCSIHCLQWDWKSGGHAKVCAGQRKVSGSNEADIPPLQNNEAKKKQTDARKEDSGSVEWVEEEVSASSKDDSATMVSMEVGQVFHQESQSTATTARKPDEKAKSENSSQSKGSLGSFLETSSPARGQKRSTPAPPPPPAPIQITDDQHPHEEGMLEDSIQQDVLFEEGGGGSDQETADEALTCISEEDSKHFQGEPDHEGSWRQREHFAEKSAAKSALGTLGVTEEVDSEYESGDMFGSQSSQGQGTSTASDGDFYQGEYQNSEDGSSTTSGSDDTSEDGEMEMLENVDMYMEAAAATPSKRAATDDKGNTDSKRAKEQIQATSAIEASDKEGEKQQPEATNPESSIPKRNSYKDFREAYRAGDADAMETSSSLKKFRELYVADKAIREDEEEMISIRMEKEMETTPADSTHGTIAAQKEALKKSINTALRDLEKIHGEEAAQAIFLRLTQNLDGIDTETLSKELSESGKGSPSNINSAGSANKSLGQRNEDPDPENLRSFEPSIAPIEPSAASVDTIRAVLTSGADTENISTTNKEERPSAIPRYMEYRTSLSSPGRASKMPSQSSQQAEAVTPDDGILQTSSQTDASRPSLIPRYLQYRSTLAKNTIEGSTPSAVEGKGFDADTAAGVAVTTKDEEDSAAVQSTGIPRYMKYRESLRSNSSNSSEPVDTAITESTLAEAGNEAQGNQNTKLPDSQSTFIPRFMHYRDSFNRETAQSDTTVPLLATKLSDSDKLSVAAALIEDGEDEEGAGERNPLASGAIDQTDSSSIPRYMQYRNTLAKKTGPSAGLSDADVGPPLEGGSKENTAGIVAAAAAVTNAASSDGDLGVTRHSAMNEPPASTMSRYMQYRNILSRNSAPIQSMETKEVEAPYTDKNEIDPLTSVSANMNKDSSVSGVSEPAPSSIPRYMQYRDTLAKNTAAKEMAVDGPVAIPLRSVSPDDNGMAPVSINPIDEHSMSRYMQYRNSLAKKTGAAAVLLENSGVGEADAEPPLQGGSYTNTSGIVAAAALASVASATVTAAVMSTSDDGKNELAASTMPRYMQYRSALATGNVSKAPVAREMGLSQSGNLEDASMSESDSSVESQPPISVPDDLANRNSRHLADSESSSSEEEEDLDENVSLADDEITTAVLSSATMTATSEAVEPVSPEEARAIQDLNRQRIAATISRVTAQGNIKPVPKSSPDDALPAQDLDRQQLVPATSTTTAVTTVAAQKSLEPNTITSPDDAVSVQDLNRQRIAATISKAMSQYKGKREVSTLHKTSEQTKQTPLEEKANTVAKKQFKEVANTSVAAYSPPPALSTPASASSPTPPPQPPKSAAVSTVAADLGRNNEKSQDPPQSAPQKRHRYILYAALILFLIVAPLSIGLGVTQRNRDSPLSSNLGTGSPTSAPDAFLVSSAPSPLLRTKAPAVSPTATPEPPTDTSPPPTPTGNAKPTREPARAELFELLSSVSSDGGTNIATPGTAQSEAFNWLASDPNATALPDERLIQRYSLATFYFSTNGDNWTSAEGWLSDEDECTWFTRSTRIPVCDENGVFQNLDLGFNEASGSISAELALLTNLVRLRLSGGTTRRISGTIPTELGLLTQLVSFDIFGNALTGQLPSDLGAWTSVQSLNVGFNRLEGSLPSTLNSMTSLVELDVSLNFFTGFLPSELSNLTSLEKLLLNNNDLNGNLQVGGLSELRELNVEGNAFTSLDSNIGNLSNLQTLRLSNNSFKGPILNNIGNLTSLVTLDMSKNAFTDQIPTQIGNLSNLRTLNLSSNRLEGAIPTQIGTLGRLLNLLLQSNSLIRPIPDEVSQLGRLTTIRLEDNFIQGSLSTVVCDAFTATRPIFYLDCGGDSPEVTCPAGSECCTFCCSTAGGCQCELEGTSSEFLCG